MAVLKKTERAKARKLWEEVFDEDTEQFLDYYDSCVADHNQILAERDGDELVSMVQLNPYQVHMGECTANSYYIVAVATREECRHQGRMRHLLTEAIERMYQEKVPFTFLMPASESIYLPFDFVTVYQQSMFACGAETGEGTDRAWHCVPCRRDQLTELTEWSDAFLQKHSKIATVRTEDYYQRIWKEQESMNGQILLFYEGTKMRGYCFTGYEGSGEAWEIAVESGKQENGVTEAEGHAWANRRAVEALTHWFGEKEWLPVRICGFLPGTKIEGILLKEISYRPMTMVRIIHLGEFVKRLRAREEVEFELNITDPIQKENSGTFRFCLGREPGRMERTENGAAPKMTIAELTAAIFGVIRTDKIPQNQIELLHPVYLNELV